VKKCATFLEAAVLARLNDGCDFRRATAVSSELRALERAFAALFCDGEILLAESQLKVDHDVPRAAHHLVVR
jgi:hypothetical protein